MRERKRSRDRYATSYNTFNCDKGPSRDVYVERKPRQGTLKELTKHVQFSSVILEFQPS